MILVTIFADLEVIAVMVMIVSGVHGTLAFLLFYGVKEVRARAYACN